MIRFAFMIFLWFASAAATGAEQSYSGDDAAQDVWLLENAARMMFLDARQCFWIWDDLDERPFHARREAAAMTAGALFAGAWLLVMVGAILGLPSI